LKKKGFSYPTKRCVRCVNVAPVARNVSRHGRNETATLATLLYIHPGSGIENNKVPLQFSGDQEFCTYNLSGMK
jgi:hypothetical protein